LDEVDIEDGAKTGHNEPSLNNDFEFNFDIDNEGPIRLNSMPDDIFDLVDKPNNGSHIPPLPQSMMKMSSLLKKSDKTAKKKKGTLKVGFSI